MKINKTKFSLFAISTYNCTEYVYYHEKSVEIKNIRELICSVLTSNKFVKIHKRLSTKICNFFSEHIIFPHKNIIIDYITTSYYRIKNRKENIQYIIPKRKK